MLIDRLNELVQICRRGLLQQAKLKAKESWGYGHCETDNDKLLRELYPTIVSLRNQALSGDLCITNKELDIIESHIHRVLGPECKIGSKDFYKGDVSPEWVLSNPDCVSYETWSDYLQAQCKKIGINFKAVVKKCASVDVNVKVVESAICDIILLPITVEEKVCKIDIDLKVDLQKCEVDFKTIVEPLKCDIDLKTYVHLLNCGISIDTIVRQLNCGATVDTILRSVDSCFTDEEVPPTCTFSYDCVEPKTCSWYKDLLVELEECNFLNQPIFEAYKVEQLPTFHINCGDCEFSIFPPDWGEGISEPVYVDDTHYKYTSTITLGGEEVFTECCTDCTQCDNCEGCSECEQRQVYHPVCILDCDRAYTDCSEACGDDEECQNGCTQTQEICYGNCLYTPAGYPPSEACCAAGYTATLESEVILFTGDPPPSYVFCPNGILTEYYQDIQYTFSDSLGNTAQCVVRWFDHFC